MTDKISVNAHSSIRIGGTKIVYIDPFRITAEDHDADFILITHPHYDHLSPEDFKKCAKEDTVFIVPDSAQHEALEAGINPDHLLTIEPGESLELEDFIVEAVPAWNTRPYHQEIFGWVGYVIKVDFRSIYIAGDTDALDENHGIKCDIALVPIGGTYTMTAEEAADFINIIRPVIAIPTHYGCLVGSPEDAKVFKARVKKGIEVVEKIKF